MSLTLKEPLQAIPDGLQSEELSLSEDGSTLLYTYDVNSEHTGIAEVLKRLNQHGIDFTDLHSSESSLEEIFVNLVRETQ